MSRFQVVTSGTDYHLGRRTALNELLEELKMRVSHEMYNDYGTLDMADVEEVVEFLLLQNPPFMVDKKKLRKNGK